jgi:hypothetical protein
MVSRRILRDFTLLSKEKPLFFLCHSLLAPSQRFRSETADDRFVARLFYDVVHRSVSSEIEHSISKSPDKKLECLAVTTRDANILLCGEADMHQRPRL